MLSQKIRLQISLLIYLIMLAILLTIKPKIFYNNKGELKPFGLNRDTHSLFPLWMAILLLAIFAFYISYVAIIFM